MQTNIYFADHLLFALRSEHIVDQFTHFMLVVIIDGAF